MFGLGRSFTYKLSDVKKHFFFIFGAPGVGKGTYAKMLVDDFGLNHISTGDQIRKILKNPSATDGSISLIREIVRSGGFVDDSIVLQIIKQRISLPESINGVILDGFPRNQNQMKLYLQAFPLHGVLNIELREDILLQQLTGRRVCLNCGTGYNVHNIQRDGYSLDPILPKKNDFCDNCNTKLVIREDDNEKVIRARLEEYRKKTEPLLNIFKEMGVMMSIEPKRGIKDYHLIRSLLASKIQTK